MWKDAFEVAGLSVDLEEARRQIGKGGDELISVFVPWWKRHRASPERIPQTQVRPFPKVRDLLLRMKLGLPAKDVLALGDTPYDAEAAGKAGIWTVGVTTGGWSAKELLFAGCIEVYRDVEDLLSNFEGSAFCR